MPNSDPQPQSQADQGVRGWLVNTAQKRVVNFKPEPGSGTTAWVSIRTYHYDPPQPPEPLNHRRMLRQNAIERRRDMLKRGWRAYRAPAR